MNLSTGTFIVAAGEGQLDVLKWLREQGPPCPWDVIACNDAAAGGHLDVLKWLRAQEPPCPWDKSACSRAAERGHLDVVKWLRGQEPPCPWDANACRRAAAGGQLDLLKWLRAQEPPCPWNEVTFFSAQTKCAFGSCFPFGGPSGHALSHTPCIPGGTWKNGQLGENLVPIVILVGFPDRSDGSNHLLFCFCCMLIF